MGRVETTYAVVLEYPCDGLLTHIGSLLWCRYCLEQIEKPVRTDVVGKLQHLWIIAPELVPEAIGETAVLNLELLVDARPFSELDDNGLGDGELAKCPHIGSQAVRQTSASRPSSLAPDTVKRSRKRSSCLGLME